MNSYTKTTLYTNNTSSIFHNRDSIQTFCNDRRNTFHFACRQWYSYNNSTMML